MCGEKVASSMITAILLGSPPRVRGKAIRQVGHLRGSGITPACAGKSHRMENGMDNARDHPRVCGEKTVWSFCRGSILGSPLRVRGKGGGAPRFDFSTGITPACAGKSSSAYRGTAADWDHPRVCGEKRRAMGCSIQPIGSPPRVRGKVLLLYFGGMKDGITPACAGKRSCTVRYGMPK